MKKISLLTSVILAVSFLTACGNSEEASSTEETEVEQTTSEAAEQPAAESNDESEKESDQSADNENGEWETNAGDTIENEAGTFTLHARNDQVDIQESGPMTLSISQANTASGELKGEMADFLEKDQIEYIQIDMEVENSSEETISFYADQATITTSTGEQLEADIWMSDHIDGDYYGQVKKSGSVFFVLDNSNAEEIEWIRVLIDAPFNEDWEDVGEKLDFKIEF
ncbi:hypothetical protein [Alkalihalophilus marmarensis]|uniref:hypothetical protein n=1 Tax=Alkalihalophilus marmarensis TaxID=521377 RepID=UPI002DBA5A25|nr:hypothetical protein [Alkalihalophilus marmarensis]MEC2073595.1 hypothetical protein [Alkalihalophilus marmarensis]